MSDVYPVPTTTEEYEKMYGKFVDPADKLLEDLDDTDLDPTIAQKIDPSIVKEISHEVNIETDEDDDSSEEAGDTDDLLEDWEQHDYHQLTGDWS